MMVGKGAFAETFDGLMDPKTKNHSLAKNPTPFSFAEAKILVDLLSL